MRVSLVYNSSNLNFWEDLNLEFDKAIDNFLKEESTEIKITNIISCIICNKLCLDPTDFNGWQCDWWADFKYKGYIFYVSGCAWCGDVTISLNY